MPQPLTVSVSPFTYEDFNPFFMLFCEHSGKPTDQLEYDKLRLITNRVLKDVFKRTRILLAKDDQGNLLGFVTLQIHHTMHSERMEILLEDLYVAKQYRRRGIGWYLFKVVEEHAKAQNAFRIRWFCREDNTGARAFYDNVGQRKTHIWYETNTWTNP